MLSQGRPYLAIPGPSVMPDRVLQAMHRPAPNIYTGELHDMTMSLLPDLRRVARTEHDVAIYIGNGHAAWEAALVNTCAPGERVLLPSSSHFSQDWANMARSLGLEVDILDSGDFAPVDPARLEAHLRADREHRIKAVLGVHVDTSTSVRSDIAAMRAAMDAAGHPALLMADCIASLGCDAFEMDGWGVDVTLAASQKGLMTPPGMAFLWLSPRAVAARERLDRVSAYWDVLPRIRPEGYWQLFCGTAPTHHLYGLRAALDMMAEEGLDAVHARHERLARAVWAAVEAWGQGGVLRLNVADAAARSWAVTSVHAPNGAGDRLRAWCEETAGLTLGIGLGRAPASDWFRIGHMGHVNAPMILGALATIDAGLGALGLPRGQGALDAASAVIAGTA